MSHKLTLKDVVLNQKKTLEMFRMYPQLFQGWKISENVESKFFLGSDRVQGLAITPPRWHYPIVVDDNGVVHYDNYNGVWGDMKDVARLVSLHDGFTSLGSLDGLQEETVNGELRLSLPTPELVDTLRL